MLGPDGRQSDQPHPLVSFQMRREVCATVSRNFIAHARQPLPDFFIISFNSAVLRGHAACPDEGYPQGRLRRRKSVVAASFPCPRLHLLIKLGHRPVVRFWSVLGFHDFASGGAHFRCQLRPAPPSRTSPLRAVPHFRLHKATLSCPDGQVHAASPGQMPLLAVPRHRIRECFCPAFHKRVKAVQ